jgi:phasin family protein
MTRTPRPTNPAPARPARTVETTPSTPENHKQQEEATMATDPDDKRTDSPFTEAIQQAKATAEEFSRMFAQMKLPALPDMEALVAAQRRNMEALSAANRIALEGAQAVARRNMEIMQQTITELGETVRALAASTDTPQARAATQAELLKRAYERAVANTREISELIQRSSGEALDLLNKRFAEALDEVKALVAKAGIGRGT